MRFDTSALEGLIPEIDNVHFFVRINHGLGGKGKKYRALLQERFHLFLELLEEYTEPLKEKIWNTGRKTDQEQASKKAEVVYFSPAYGIYLHRANRHGWSYVHFEPNKKTLELVQSWLLSFYGSRHTLERNVSLKRIEYAYDIFFEGGDADDYAALALRIGRHIWPKHATNTFAVAIVGETTKKADGSVNGPLSLYVQSCKRPDRFKLSKELNYNPEATKHLTIYPKAINGSWFLRIEAALAGPKAKSLVQYDNFPGLLDCVKQFPVGELFTFRKAYCRRFLSREIPKPGSSLSEKIKYHAWWSALKDGGCYPVSEKVRLMRAAASRNKISGRTVSRYMQGINFAEVVNTARSDNFRISQRKGEKPLPDDLPSSGKIVKLRGFWNVHAKVRKSQPEPLKQQCLFGLVTGRNCPYLR